MSRIHALLSIQSLLAIFVSINRLSTLALGYVLPNEFLRWVDFNNMLVIPLISLVATYLLKKTIEYDSPAREAARIWPGIWCSSLACISRLQVMVTMK